MRRDLQLLWVIAGAVGFWLAVWQHDLVLEYSKKAYSAASGFVSGGGRLKVNP